MNELEATKSHLDWAYAEFAELGDSGSYRMIKKLEARVAELEAEADAAVAQEQAEARQDAWEADGHDRRGDR